MATVLRNEIDISSGGKKLRVKPIQGHPKGQAILALIPLKHIQDPAIGHRPP